MKTLNNISSEKFANQVFNEIDENFDDVKSAIDTLEQSGGGGGSSSRTLMMAALGASTTVDGTNGTWHDGTSIYKIISRILGATDYRNYAGAGQQMRVSIAGTQVNNLLADATFKNSDFVFLQCGWNDVSQYAQSDATKIGDADSILAYYKANDLGHESDPSFLTNEIYDTSLGWLFKGIYRLLAGLKESAVLVVCSPIKSSLYTSSIWTDTKNAWINGIRKIVLYFGRYQFESSVTAHEHVDKWFKRIRFVDCKNLPILDEDITMYYDRYLNGGNADYTHPNNQGCAIVAHYIVSQFWRNGLYQSVVTSGGGGGGTETDPVFKASPAYGITEAKITEWNNKYTKPSGGIPASDLAFPINDSVFGKMQNGEFLQGTYSTNGWAFNMNPVTPQVNKTYVDVEANTIYRYSGSAYVALGAASGGATYEAMSQAEVTAGTGITARTITPKLLRDNFYTESEVDDKLRQKADVPSLVEVTTSGAVSQALAPNTFYKFSGSLTSLTLTLTAGTGLVLYAGKFSTGSGWTNNGLSLPASVTEAAGNDEIAASKTYEFSILDNVIVIKEV